MTDRLAHDPTEGLDFKRGREADDRDQRRQQREGRLEGERTRVAEAVGGAEPSDSVGWGDTIDAVWAVLRWPAGAALAVTSIALLFEHAPRRRQPEPSWLAFGAGAAALLWLCFMAMLVVYLEATDSFGTTYGPIAGTIGVLLWTFLSAVALFLGLAFAAQLEAVRAGVMHPRVERDENV